MDKNLKTIRHERSKKDFPGLKLEKDEYVEIALSRAPLCLLMIWLGVVFAVIVFATVFLISSLAIPGIDETGLSFMTLLFWIFVIFFIMCGIVATIVFRGNKMYITNKRITQQRMLSPVVTSVNIIDLSAIEDVSFRQTNLLQKIFSYGTLRLSTVGDETTYTFPFSNVTGEEISKIVELVNYDREHSGEGDEE